MVSLAVADLMLASVIPDAHGRKAAIIASALVDGAHKMVVLVHGFGNRGAAASYLRLHQAMLMDRATGWLSGETARPDFETARHLLRGELQACFGPKLRRLLLTGSRARGNWREDSDCDIVAIVEEARPCGPQGPLPKALYALDGNPVDLIVIPPADFDSPARFLAEMRVNHFDL
jgi:predicted nucleotidyltransferase